MKARFSIFVDLPVDTETKDISINGVNQEDKTTVVLSFRDIARTAFYHEDPNDGNRTILKVGEDKFSINMTRKKFDLLLVQIEKDELFRTACLN